MGVVDSTGMLCVCYLLTCSKQSIWQSAEQGQFLHSCHFLLNKKAESVLGRWRVIMPLFQAICHLFYILNILRISLKKTPKQSIWR